jgi:hypothetical protein
MGKIIKTNITEASDIEANWKSKDPVLLKGQLAFTTDGENAGAYKIGDGNNKWSNLDYNYTIDKSYLGSLKDLHDNDVAGINTESLNNDVISIKAKLDTVEENAQVNKVTGVKGNQEEEYRTGNINITPDNIGAITENDVFSDISNGLVPAPSNTGSELFLRSDGAWGVPPSLSLNEIVESVDFSKYEVNYKTTLSTTKTYTTQLSRNTIYTLYFYGVRAFFYTNPKSEVKIDVYVYDNDTKEKSLSLYSDTLEIPNIYSILIGKSDVFTIDTNTISDPLLRICITVTPVVEKPNLSTCKKYTTQGYTVYSLGNKLGYPPTKDMVSYVGSRTLKFYDAMAISGNSFLINSYEGPNYSTEQNWVATTSTSNGTNGPIGWVYDKTNDITYIYLIAYDPYKRDTYVIFKSDAYNLAFIRAYHLDNTYPSQNQYIESESISLKYEKSLAIDLIADTDSDDSYNLKWKTQVADEMTGEMTWLNDRIILDSENYSNFTSKKWNKLLSVTSTTTAVTQSIAYQIDEISCSDIEICLIAYSTDSSVNTYSNTFSLNTLPNNPTLILSGNSGNIASVMLNTNSLSTSTIKLLVYPYTLDVYYRYI